MRQRVCTGCIPANVMLQRFAELLWERESSVLDCEEVEPNWELGRLVLFSFFVLLSLEEGRARLPFQEMVDDSSFGAKH